MGDPMRSSDIREVLQESSDDCESDIDQDEVLLDYSSGSGEEYQPDDNDLDSSDNDEDVNSRVVSNVNRPNNSPQNVNYAVQPINPWVRVYPPEPQQDIPSKFKVRNPGIRNCPPRNSKPIDYLMLFFTLGFWNHITRETNKYAEEIMAKKRNSGTLKTFSRIKKWENVSVSELKKFFSIIINMGLSGLSKPMKSFWDTRTSQINPFYSKTMTVNRFLAILSCFHMTSTQNIPKGQPGHDPWHKIRFIFTHLNDNFKKYFVPFQNICIDESLIGMKNRCPYIQYLPNKKHKQFGIKKFELCDSSTNYVYHIEFYSGKGFLNTNDNTPFTEKVIFDLLTKSNMLDKWYHLYTDNFYTKIPLAKNLFDRNTFISGTVNKMSKFLPNGIKNIKLNPRESMYYRQGDLLLVAYKQTVTRKPVLVLSTACHAEDTIARSKKTNLEGLKPVVIQQYNNYMGGVDVSDKTMYHNSCNRMTRKFWKKMFFNLVDIAVFNSYIIYKDNTDRPMARRDFIIDIVESLVETEEVQPAHDTNLHKLEKLPGKTERKCIICSRPNKRDRTTFYCPGCNVGVHKHCFHKLDHYWRPTRAGRKRKASESDSD